MEQVILKLTLNQQSLAETTDCLTLFPNDKLAFQAFMIQDFHPDNLFKTIQEQVAGYTEKMVIEIQLDKDCVPTLLSYLKQSLPKLQANYYVISLQSNGVL